MAPTTRSSNPTHGQKVDLGADAPVTEEGHGKLSGSLAAESQAFKEANDISEEQTSHRTKETSTSSSKGKHASGSSSRQGGGLGSASDSHRGNSSKDSSAGNKSGFKNLGESHADPAPTYVNNVLGTNRDPHEGPHGTNIKEDDSIRSEDKNNNASFSELGTKADPGRLAEAKFKLGSQGGSTTSSGGQRKGGGDGKAAFDVLDPSTNA